MDKQRLVGVRALAFTIFFCIRLSAVDIPLYRVFETSITNSKSYTNKFSDVTLEAVFTSPSGEEIEFWGFYDGDGDGGQSGDQWGLRFMPNETGTWSYTYSWSDGTDGGEGSFRCTEQGKGKGLLKAYESNTHWLAYNGDEPVFIKSYYIKPHGEITQPISWIGPNVYQKLIDKGYNHFQMAPLLPISYMDQTFKDGPANIDDELMDDNDPAKMNLEIWKHVDEHLSWLNDRDIGVHFFQGFHGKKQYIINFQRMNDERRELYVRYVAARMAPYAIIAGWNYSWETGGGGDEVDLANLLDKYDPWDHLRTYHDGKPKDNNYSKDCYTFASIEDHGEIDDYHDCVDAYEGKPVFMSEGNDLWRSCWHGSQTSIRRQAWHVTCAGASFTWNDLPSCGTDNQSTDILSWENASQAIEVLNAIMSEKVVFHAMKPAPDLLSDSEYRTYCLAQPGAQYLVYEEEGGSFDLSLKAGTYDAQWIDAQSGESQDARDGSVSVDNDTKVSFATPNTGADWVLVLRDLGVTVTAAGPRNFSSKESSAITIVSAGSLLRITGLRGEGERIELFTISGQLLEKVEHNTNSSILAPHHSAGGICILRINGKAQALVYKR